MLMMCRQGCCRNPYGVCGRSYECPCHEVTLPPETLQADLYRADHRNNTRDPEGHH